MSNYDTIESNDGDIVGAGVVLTVQLVWLAMNYRWALTELTVEAGKGGAWSPWLVLGVSFVLLTLFEFLYWIYRGIDMRLKDPMRG